MWTRLTCGVGVVNMVGTFEKGEPAGTGAWEGADGSRYEGEFRGYTREGAYRPAPFGYSLGNCSGEGLGPYSCGMYGRPHSAWLMQIGEGGAWRFCK
jgi:hypothetical protein